MAIYGRYLLPSAFNKGIYGLQYISAAFQEAMRRGLVLSDYE